MLNSSFICVTQYHLKYKIQIAAGQTAKIGFFAFYTRPIKLVQEGKNLPLTFGISGSILEGSKGQHPGLENLCRHWKSI